jgi:DNA-binding MarR family transcriptional regulator
MSESNPYKGLSELELRILKLSNAGYEDIDIAEELQMDEAAVADIVDKLDAGGFLL